MPTIRGGATTVPVTARAAVISFASSPVGSYSPDLEYELMGARATSSAADLPRMTFARRVGTLKHPHQVAFGVDRTVDLLGDWVSLKFSGPTGLSDVQFVGVIIHERTVMHGTDEGLTGRQVWTAVGPLHLLRRINISTAFWIEGASVIEGERVASFNARDVRGMLVGNRSASVQGVSYVFGGTDTWTRRQAVDYLLARYANAGGVTWSISGDVGLLDVATDTIELGQSGTVANALRRILSPTFGLDFTVEKGGGGFELRVFSLVSKAVIFQGATIPRNPRRTRIAVGDRVDVERVEFTRAHDQRYSRVRLRGGRIVVALTLDASKGHLVPKWSAALETEYKAGTGTTADDPELHDAARRAPRFEAVYSSFGASNPFALSDVAAGLELDASGNLTSVAAEHQSSSRETLHWLPLRDGFDYAGGEPEDNTLSGHEADFRRAAAWIFDAGVARFLPAESLGFSVSALRNDWGVALHGDTAHRLALGRWAGAEATETTPEHDLGLIVATVAIRSDVRLSMESVLEDGEDDGTVLDLEAPGLELWMVAPGAAVGVAADGTLATVSESITLRDDRARMAAVMAGAIARYQVTRARAEVVLRGYQPWASALGSILVALTGTGVSEDVGAPVTTVDYQGGDSPRTIIRAGYEG